MLAGHYGASYAIKKVERSLSLWELFLAAQFMDVMWSILVLLGVEKLHVHPGMMAASHLELYYMPFTHSLTGSLFWSALMYLAYRFVVPAPAGANRGRRALMMGAAVFSHWVLDLIVHDGDLPLIGNLLKVGFGLYRSLPATAILETVCLLGGVWLYLQITQSKQSSGLGKVSMQIFAVLMSLVNILLMTIAPPSEAGTAIFLLLFYAISCTMVAWLEGKRMPVQEAPARGRALAG